MIHKKTDKILVLDGQWRNTLSVVRSLGRHGLKVDVGEDTAIALCSFSKYIQHRFVYQSVKKNPEVFLKYLLNRIKNEHYDMVIPITDAMVSILSEQREEIEKYTIFPFVENTKLQIAHDKEKTLLLAKKLKIPIPKSYFPGDYNDIDQLFDKMKYPVLLKPRSSYGSRGIARVNDWSELKREYEKIQVSYGKPLIQELIPQEGRGIGVSLLYNFKHEIRAHFCHVRLREFPITGGPSTLRESTWNPDLVDKADLLLRSIGWTGIAMVEFKMDPRDGIPKLMEINPRFWGSLELAVQSGVDFPWMLYRLYMDGSVKKCNKYIIGHRCRWLIPGDILHFLANPDRFKMQPSFFKFFDKQTGYDIISKDDPLPVLGRILFILSQIFSRETWTFVWRR